MEQKAFENVLKSKFNFIVNHYGLKMESVKKDIRKTIVVGLDEWLNSASFKEKIKITVDASLDKSTQEYLQKVSEMRKAAENNINANDSNLNLSALLDEDDFNVTPELDSLMSQNSMIAEKSEDGKNNDAEEVKVEPKFDVDDFQTSIKDEKAEENIDKGNMKDKTIKTLKSKKRKGPAGDEYVPFNTKLMKKPKKQKGSDSDDNDI